MKGTGQMLRWIETDRNIGEIESIGGIYLYL